MTAIKINQFGGLSPSVDPRNLGPDGAQVARNLDLRFGDFRPSKGLGAAVATVPPGTKSIFRTPSGVWLSSLTDTDYANAQVNDAASERVYLTGRSGFPEAWQDGQYRRLGVPAPTAKPSATVIVVDEFDSEDAQTATEKATVAALAAITAVDSEVLLGSAAPTGIAPAGAFDPLYSKVQLHLKFDSLWAGEFLDSSPQRRLVTKEPGVAFLNDASGPLGAAGAGCAQLTGGTGVGGLTFGQITRLGTEADKTWTVDMWLTATETLPELTIESWRGAGDDFANPNMRKLAFLRADGAYRTVMSNINGSFSTALRCRRADGSPVLTAGVPALISLQNNGSTVQAFVDGQLAGQTPWPLGLEFSHFGRATNVAVEAFIGKVDELRVTFAARYTGNFTRPVTPFPVLAAPTGQFAGHAAPGFIGLPTASAEDAAYLIELTLSGGNYIAANPADEYLRALPGAQVTNGGAQYWAVSAPGYRATGLTATTAAIQAAIAAVDNPATVSVDALLTAPQAAALAPFLADVYDPLTPPLSTLVADLNSAQAALAAQLAVTPGSGATVATKLSLLAAASTAVETYFAGINTKLRAVLQANASTIFGAINSGVVNREVETRGYIVTFVTDWGEESAPSPVTELLTLDQNDKVQINAPLPTAGRNIVGWRLYRSSTTDRSAAFQLIDGTGAGNAVLENGSFAYFGIGDLGYLDGKQQAELQEPCQTLTWVEPPANLKGLVALPNGIMAGFFGKTLCFCEPFAPYAWPVEYQQTIKHNIVGLGVFGQTVVVLTEGSPYYASGADSANMSAQEIESPQSCVAKRTIAAVEGGVMYASPDGLCLASSGGVKVLTYDAFSKVDWQAMVGAGAFGAYSDGSYYLFTDSD
jgi:hypothetical protein